MLICLAAPSRRDEAAKRRSGEAFQRANSENVYANEPMNRRRMFFFRENKFHAFVANRTNFSLLPHNEGLLVHSIVEINDFLLFDFYSVLLQSNSESPK